MTLRHLWIFEAVYRLSNITRAAADLPYRLRRDSVWICLPYPLPF